MPPGGAVPLPAGRPAPAGSAVARAVRRLETGVGSPGLERLVALAGRLVHSAHAELTLVGEQQVRAAAAGTDPRPVGEPGPLAEALCSVTARQHTTLVVSDAATDDRVRALPLVASGRVGAYLGAPLVDRTGQVVGALCAYDDHPRAWSVDDERVLVELGAAALAELELAAVLAEAARDRARLELALDVAGTGTWEVDLPGRIAIWDERCTALFGCAPPQQPGDLAALLRRVVHPDDLANVQQAVVASVTTGAPYRSEHRVDRNGETGWVLVRGRVLPDGSGAAATLLGSVIDVTDAHLAAQDLVDAARRAATLAEVVSALAVAADPAQVEQVLVGTGLAALGAIGGALALHRPDDDEPDPLLAQVVRTGRLALSDDEQGAQVAVPLLSRARSRTEAAGVLTAHFPAGQVLGGADLEQLAALAGEAGTALARIESDGERDAARAAALGAQQRLSLLVEATRALSSTLDVQEALGRLARLVVPRLADWCVVSSVDDEGRLHDVAHSHADPELRPVVEQYAALRLGQLQGDSPALRAVRTQEVVAVEDMPGAVRDHLRPGPAVELLARLQPASAVFFPVRARGRVVGLLSTYRSLERGPLGDDDLGTATELTQRAGLAVDNARLYGQQQRLAEALQTSLLTPPPQPDHGQIEVRYRPAAHTAQVGGDWYDAFLQADGATVLAIGDVIGHDSAAAAAMGQVRGLLRGIAYTTGAGPAEVLSRLDRAMAGLDVQTTATAVVARLEQSEQQRGRAETTLRWSNAGHPPPMVLMPGGGVRTLDGQEDLLLGVVPEIDRAEREVVLPRDTTIVLYTDGLVERRGLGLDDGLARLRQALTALSDRPLDELCDGLLERLTTPDAEDDVAIIAIRLHREDRPRPAEAGPEQLPAHRPPPS